MEGQASGCIWPEPPRNRLVVRFSSLGGTSINLCLGVPFEPFGRRLDATSRCALALLVNRYQDTGGPRRAANLLPSWSSTCPVDASLSYQFLRDLRRASLGLSQPDTNQRASPVAGVVRPPPDRADVAAVDADSDGGFVTDGCDGMDIVVGGAADGHLPGLPQLLTGRRQRRRAVGATGLR